MNNSIVFDMDGVLFDSERIYYRAWFEAARKLNLPEVDTCITHCIGRNGSDIRDYLLGQYGQDFKVDAFIEDIRSEFTKIVDTEGLPVKDGVLELLEWLTQQKWSVALATSSGRNGTERNLTATGLKHYLQIIVTGDMIQHGKPAPDIYLLACEKLGAAPADCYAVEDSPNGVKSAYAAGLKTILVPDMLDPDPEIRQLAFRVFPSLVEVKTFLENLEN